MNPRVLLRSPGFLPERQLLKSSTQSLTSHLARPPSLNFQKSFLFVASSSGNSGRRAFSSSPTGRFTDGGGGAVGAGSGVECRKGGEEVEGEGGEKGWSCGEEGEEGGHEGDERGSGEYKGGGVNSDSGRELQGSNDVGTGTPWHHEGIDLVKRPSELSVTIKGKLLPTPSRLLKLLLPLKLAGSPHPIDSPLTLLVHPQQPLSYLERLIQAELPPITSPGSTPRPPNISFKALNLGDPPRKAQTNIGSKKGPQPLRGEEGEGGVGISRGFGSLNPCEEGGYVCWPTSTEVGDFIHNVARGKEFVIEVEGRDCVPVGMPSFKQWTHYLRQRLVVVTREIELQVRFKSKCDRIARRGAQRVAVSGFLGLMGCLAAVYWLAFKASLGWALMEPVIVVSGYLLLLYNNRQVLSKRQKLYREKGFDMDEWEELVYEGKALRREIRTIAEEYDVGWDERSDEVGGNKVVRLLNESGRDGRGRGRD